jgi:hypothetical protein
MPSLTGSIDLKNIIVVKRKAVKIKIFPKFDNLL